MTAADRIALRVHECASITSLIEEHAQSELANLILTTRLSALQDALSDCAEDGEDPSKDPDEPEEIEESEEAAEAELAAATAAPVTAPLELDPERFLALCRGEATAEGATEEPPAEAEDLSPLPTAAPPPPEPSGATIPPEALRGALTQARAEALLRMWPDRGQTLAQIHRALLALPGPPIPSDTSLYPLAERLGLPRKRSEAYAAADAEPATADPSPDADGGRSADADGAFAGLPADDIAEARGMVARGDGAKTLHEYFGWDLPRAQAIAAALRAEAKAAAA